MKDDSLVLLHLLASLSTSRVFQHQLASLVRACSPGNEQLTRSACVLQAVTAVPHLSSSINPACSGQGARDTSSQAVLTTAAPSGFASDYEVSTASSSTPSTLASGHDSFGHPAAVETDADTVVRRHHDGTQDHVSCQSTLPLPFICKSCIRALCGQFSA